MTDDLKARLRGALVGTTRGPWTLCAHLRMENENGCTCGYRGVIFAGETEFAICQPGHDVTIGEEGLDPPRLPRSEEIANSRFIAAARDLMPEALDRIEALELALTQSRAETAAAYERAAKAVTDAPVFSDNDTDGQSAAKVIALGRAAKAIRALPTPDQTAVLAEARAHGMREAAMLIVKHEMGTPMHSPPQLLTEAHDRILAAIKGAKA